MADTIQVDVIQRGSVEPNGWIPIINQWSPAESVSVDENTARQLLQIGNLFVYISGTETLLTGRNFREYFPDGGGGGGGEGDKSRYTIKKETAASGEVTYKLMQSINGGSSAKVGDIIGLRGNQMLVNYGGDLIILNTAIATMKDKIDSQYNFTTFTALNITTSGKNLKQITDELYAKNLPTNTIVTGQLYTPALPFAGNGEAEVMINGPAFWWTCKSLTTAPYSWNAIAGGGSWSGVKMDWTPSFTPVDASMSDSSVNAVQNKVIKKYVDDSVGDKVDKVSGKGLSTNDYTTEEKTKLGGLVDIQSIGDGLSLDNGELSATGGGGTEDYEDLENQPSINNITLVGNKSLSDLGIAAESDIPTDLADLTDDATHRVVTDTEKSTWNGKQSALDATQMNAVNSGITAAAVSQIATNTSDISTINGIIGDINDTLEGVL
jgi:hypothetical protein